MVKKAVVLLSGGLDSATTLAMAKDEGYALHAISFDYGQRHHAELHAARKIARAAAVSQHVTVMVDSVVFQGSALTSREISVPPILESSGPGIPPTYVPARNTVFLSLALSWAESIGALDIFIGVTAVDYSGYPDCRPEYIQAYERMANLATKAGVEGERIRIHAPLINLSKAKIIQKGIELGVDYSLTHSCYDPGKEGQACGVCDACVIRESGFTALGLSDPAIIGG